MIKPAPTNNEAERLAILRSYGVLDTPAEKDFDDLVALAAHICGTPIAIITLVDESRQWFKATFGLAITETARDVSFCGHTINQTGMFVVPDALRDERFADNPLVVGDPNIRFYAGSPLIAPAGHALGSLGVIDRRPRQLDAAQEQALAVLGRHVMALLELRRHTQKMTRANHALLGILEDERLAEKELKETRALYHSLVEQMPAGIFRKDAGGRFVFVNSWFCKFSQTLPEHYLGLTPAESVQAMVKSKATILDAENATELALRGVEHHAAIMRTGRQIELEESRTLINGQRHYFHVTKSPVFNAEGKVVGSQGILMDITARKQAEIRIQQLNRVYAMLSDINQTIVREKNSPALLDAACRIAVERGQFRMAWIGLLDAQTQQVNPVASAGATENYLEKLDINLADPARKTSPASIAILTGEHAVSNDIAHDVIMETQRETALACGYRSTAAFPLKVNGKITGVFHLYSDELNFFDADEVRLLDELAADISFALEIHEREAAREHAEEELRWRTVLSEAVVNSTLDGILVVDVQGKKLVQNHRLNDIWQIPPEIVACPDHTRQFDFIAGEVKKPEQFAEKVKYLYAHPNVISTDEIELKNGKVLDRYSSPVRGQDGKHYGRIWVFRDVTERHEFEMQLRQAQKMEAVGQLAGGVAHDFNNILAVIQMQAGLLKFTAGVSAEQLELTAEIEASAQRAAALTRQLLLFSRREALQTRDLDLSETIVSMTKMLQRTLGEDIRMEFKFAAQPLFIHADAGMMDQILMNLAVNSRDAMPKGGLLIIETSAVELDEFAVAQSPHARAGSFVCLSVSDTGEGIPPEVMPRIFEPFFTTKDVGKGTGLGLATIFGIVQQHKGWIDVYSETGQGTIFRIYLPRQTDLAAKKTAPSPTITQSLGQETILLVEDDLSLRTAVRKALSQLGYRICEASSGVNAMKVWQAHRHEISLLMTDLVMPDGMNGKELADKLLAESPRLKVIYTSGYSAEVVGHDFPLQEGVNFLTKPFEAHKLAQIVRARLDS